jgi:hypothetical protein
LCGRRPAPSVWRVTLQHRGVYAIAQRRIVHPGTVRMRNLRKQAAPHPKENTMSLGTILLIVLVLVLVGVIPSWSHSRSWGYGPSGGIGLVLLVVVILLVLGKL